MDDPSETTKPRAEHASPWAEHARLQAAAQTRPDDVRLSAQCPHTFEQLMERPVTWPPGA